MKTGWLVFLGVAAAMSAAALEPVAYSPPPRQTVTIPVAAAAPVLDGVLDDAVWSKANRFDDFRRYKSEAAPEAATRVTVLRHGGDLYLGIRCEEPGEVAAGIGEDGFAIWQGDLVEIFFGAMEPEAWCMQFGVGAGGGRFSDSGDYASWEAATSADEHGWSAEVRIPLRMLTVADSGIGFNLCRQRKNAGELSSWGPVRQSFHEPESFGELLLNSYGDAALTRFGMAPDGVLDRAGYERLAAEHTPAAAGVAHGPWLSNPTASGITVNWVTNGKTAAFIEYREAGSGEWREVPAALQNGIVRADGKLHVVDLDRLKPGTSYEYRLRHRVSSAPEAEYAPGGSFTTLSPERERYRFALFSDIHGDSRTLEQLWRNSDAPAADFYINLGDMLSSLNGPSAFFDGFLDIETKLFATDKPLVLVRGNHELRGFFAGGYFDYMRHPSGKTYYAFAHGPVFFVVLDGATDHAGGDDLVRTGEFMREQREWLERVAESDAFRDARFRVVLAHFPLWDERSFETRVMRGLMNGILAGTGPERRVHLMLGGHLHKYFRINPDGGPVKTLDGKFASAELPRVPFAIVGNGGPGGDGGSSILTVDVAPEALTLKAFDTAGKLLDTFQIRPDGRVEEK